VRSNVLLIKKQTDPPSQDDYSAMYELYMRTGQGFVLVYAINSPSSFEKLHEFRSRILQVKGRDNVPLVLVGNKYDLTNERKVTTEEGMDLAKTWNCPFFETSAKTGINVEECFFQLVREIRKDNLSKHSGNKKRESKLRDCKFM
jgi:GTPase KRas protein